jgi:hypothetical protein
VLVVYTTLQKSRLLSFLPSISVTDRLIVNVLSGSVNNFSSLYHTAPNRKSDHLHVRAGTATAYLSSFSARKPSTPYESTKIESAAQSMINLSMAIGGGVGGLAKEGTRALRCLPLTMRSRREVLSRHLNPEFHTAASGLIGDLT